MNTRDYQFTSAAKIARETEKFNAQDEDQREKWLIDALNNAYDPDQTENEWLLRAGYIREVSHAEIIDALAVVALGSDDENETMILPWPNSYTIIEDVNGDSVPRDWHSDSELRTFLVGRTIVELPRV